MKNGKKFDLSGAKDLFFQESREMLDDMESFLLTLEKNFSDEEIINSLFRAIHTIKGSSGMFAFVKIEKFTHLVETLLDQARNFDIKITTEIIDILLKSHDYIDNLLKMYEKEDTVLSDKLQKTNDDLIKKLKKILSNQKDEITNGQIITKKPEEELQNSADDIEKDNELLVQNKYWHISLRFHGDIFKNGMDPKTYLLYLKDKGEFINIITIVEDIPLLSEIDPENCYIGFEIIFDGDITKDKILEIFEFVIDDCDVVIVPPKSSIIEYVNFLNDFKDESMRIGDMLIQVGALSEKELNDAIKIQNQYVDESETSDVLEEKSLIGKILVDEKMVQKPVLNAALSKQEIIQKNIIKKNKSIRIDADKIDDLINLVGELVVSGSNVKQKADSGEDTELIEAVSVISRLISDVRDSAMNIRMVPIGETFKRFERVVRDLSQDADKKIDFTINGSETELDKTIIEKISDPLMHLIRNSIDHGIESPEERVENNKTDTGTIFLNAYYKTGSVVIEIVDDGKGLDKSKILEKALEKGIIPKDHNLQEDEIFQLIFEPGFSTAEKVTNISGRGVGMDVVKRNIQALRGVVSIHSVEGEGTQIMITLPLTLAIVDGFMVDIDSVKYIVPLDMVIECYKTNKSELENGEGGNFINLRGEILPFLRMREFFDLDSDQTLEEENIIVLEYAGKKAGLIIDNPIGEFQTVVKPLGKIFSQLIWISGATILGTGEVALILDVPMLIKHIKDIKLK